MPLLFAYGKNRFSHDMAHNKADGYVYVTSALAWQCIGVQFSIPLTSVLVSINAHIASILAFEFQVLNFIPVS